MIFKNYSVLDETKKICCCVQRTAVPKWLFQSEERVRMGINYLAANN
jgi:hypothetical protein